MGVGGRKRAVPENTEDVNGNTQKRSEYEELREKRIKENQERMQKLGIFDISLKLNSFNNNKTIRKTPQRFSPLIPSQQPPRRSSRLQNTTPLSYSEVHLSKIDKSLEGEHHLLREDGSRPEIYTEEHEKMLGTTDLSWTPFVDGYGNDGKRIYDPIKGKTCHQCRQKTLGHRTHCCKCSMVQGQFCGDCLYMRYGEHVLEAKKNPNWICPVCRGICNCSLCRQAKGWAPTGPLYKKIARLGYKSVAHYLIQTHRGDVSSEKTAASAKRSLPFSDMEVTKDEEFCNRDSQGQVVTNKTALKTVEGCDPNENKVAPESSIDPLHKPAFADESSAKPLLPQKHDYENSIANLVLSCDDVGNFSADNKPGNANAVLVGSVLTSNAPVPTEFKTVEYDPSENKVAPESSIDPLHKPAFADESSVKPLLPQKHDYENSIANLVLSCDDVGNFSADNKPGNANAVLVGSVLTSNAPVPTEFKTVEYDPSENKVAPESSTEPLLKPAFAAESSVEPLLPLKHDAEDSGPNLVLSCDKVGNFSADDKPGNENPALVGSALTSSAPVLTELNDGYKGESQLRNELDVENIQSKEEKEGQTCVSDDKNCDGMVAPEASSKSKKKPLRAAAQVIDSIAGRLRQRRGRGSVEA